MKVNTYMITHFLHSVLEGQFLKVMINVEMRNRHMAKLDLFVVRVMHEYTYDKY